MPWYGVGTITIAANGTTATGTGTQFIGNVRVGDGIAIQGSASLHEVTGVTSNTQLSFSPPYAGTAGSGKAFRIVPVLGYDKDLSDAFNQLRLQFGDQLSNLQPWATAPTQDAALTALGMSTSGKAVATGTPAQGRTALGLGTAATRDVGESSGNVMAVGARNWGATTTPLNGLNFNDLSNRVLYPSSGASYLYSGQNEGGPSAAGTHVLTMKVDDAFMAQLAMQHSGRTYVRGVASGAISDWSEVIRTASLLSGTGQSTLYPMTQKAVTDALNTKANTSTLGTAATRNVGESSGNVMEVGAFGWGGSSLPSSSYDAQDATAPTRVTNFPSGIFLDLVPLGVHFKRVDNAAAAQLAFSEAAGRMFFRTAMNGVWVPPREILHTSNTTIDSNGFLKNASPIIKLHSDRIELNGEDGPAFERIEAGHYQLTGCNGLRLDDGWYIETPHDKNGNKYFNVEWEQDSTPETDAGILEEAADVTLTIRCYERVWNATTGQFDNGDPVDIPDGRWIDLRLNEVRVEEPEMPDEPEQPVPSPEPAGPIIPNVVTMAQAKLALLYAGLLEAAEQYINELPEPQKTAALIEWNHRQTLEREHPLVGQVATALELTEQQLDELFVDAAGR